MARRRKGRDVHGILLLDKPSGVTSNHALQRVKRLFFARKAGHTGSLDPLASGLLPICLGHATKVSSYLLDSNKRYEVTGKFGQRTDTGDADGQVTEQTSVVPKLALLPDVLKQLLGESLQVPPMYSALKHQGQRLYELARKGEVVERPPRSIVLYELNCLAADEDSFRLEISCSKGTYVRTLVEDIAKQLGTLAHVTRLRRTGAGPFDATDLLTLEELEATQAGAPENLDQLLLPVDRAIAHWPAVTMDADTSYYLLNGQVVQVANPPEIGPVRLYQEDIGLVGLGEVLADGRVAPRRLFR